MKLFVTAAALAFGILTCSANADEESPFQHQINLKAKVDPSCSFSGVMFDGDGFSYGSDAGQSTFTVPIVENKASPTSGSIRFTQFSCNAKLRVFLTGNGSLTNGVTGTNPAEFETKIQYLASIDPGDAHYVEMPFNGSGSTGDIFLEPSTALGIQIKIDIPESGALSAGTYEDTLTINFRPQV